MTAAVLDFSNVRLIDNHCHPINRDLAVASAESWRSFFSESSEPETSQEHVTSTAFYRRLIHHLAEFFGCSVDEASILEARRSAGPEQAARRLFEASRIDTLVVDTGYPPPPAGMSLDQMAALAGCRIVRILRLEVLMQELIADHGSFGELVEALRGRLTDIRGQGYVGLKSIAAYRGGLDIQEWDVADAKAGFQEAREEVARNGSVRLAHRPLLHTLLMVAFAEAAGQELPVQFHTGYGDTDANMLLANPLHLRWLLERRDLRGMKVILLHESYPYTREGGYLSAVYDRVYLDLSYAIPFLGFAEMLRFTRHAFGVAPLSKLLYASDAVHLPELFWMSAVDGRRVLGQALGELVRDGDFSEDEARDAGEAILRGNAIKLYGLGA